MKVGRIIDGKAFAARLREQVATGVEGFAAQAGRKPGLAVVLVGEDPASSVYVRNKGKATISAGMESLEFHRPATIGQDELLELIDELNGDDEVDGILVQLPLPGHIDDKAVIAAIDPAKDVDGFHIVNAGRLAVGEEFEAEAVVMAVTVVLAVGERQGDVVGRIVEDGQAGADSR